MIIGMATGLAAALCQSVSYLCSRWFLDRFPGGQLHLLAWAHIAMGVVSLALLPLVATADVWAWRGYLAPAVGAAGFYLLGQTCLFRALRRADASRVSPLLGLKILILAGIALVFAGTRFTAWQWTAVVISVAAAGLLSRSGAVLARSSWGWILLACVCYCLSDLSIRRLMACFPDLSLAHAALLGSCLCYLLCGLAGVTLAAWLGRPAPGMVTAALPFAAAWFVAMLFLFATFALVGVVFGNILQATRGVISVALGAAVARAGWVRIETRTSRRVFGYRLAAAAIMIAAIALFYLGG